MISLPKENLQYIHARHKTFSGFTSICAHWTVQEQKPEMLPYRVRIHPRTPPSAVCAWFVGQASSGKTISTELTGLA